eukprot:1652098-Rhodomonas_salina.1
MIGAWQCTVTGALEEIDTNSKKTLLGVRGGSRIVGGTHGVKQRNRRRGSFGSDGARQLARLYRRQPPQSSFARHPSDKPCPFQRARYPDAKPKALGSWAVGEVVGPSRNDTARCRLPCVLAHCTQHGPDDVRGASRLQTTRCLVIVTSESAKSV